MPARIRPNVAKMPAYRPGKPIEEVQRELGIADVIKLGSNENPLGPSPKALAAVREAAAKMNCYPDASGFALREALSVRFGVDAAQIVIGNGSDEILDLLGHMFLSGPEDKIVYPWPSFLRYPLMAAVTGAVDGAVALAADWSVDVDAMVGALDERVRLVMLANPNNPTGTVTGVSKASRMLDALPDGAVLVMDEAYYDFAVGVDGYPDSVQWLKDDRPVVVVRTFSKSYGLAGVRIGYAFMPPEVADAYNRIAQPFNVSVLAQAAGIAALDDEEHLRATLANNSSGRSRIVAWMRTHGFATIESHANFVCVEVPGPAGEYADALLRHGVIVRPGGALGMPNHLRVSIGKPEELERFLSAFEKVVGAAVAN